jgi:hypothetical protein
VDAGIVGTDVGGTISVDVSLGVDCGAGVSVADEVVVGVNGDGVMVPGAGWQAASRITNNTKNLFNTLSSSPIYT